jgi:hypothetical protein
MKLIKLFEQFVSEESEAESGAEDTSMTKPKTVLNPQTLLDNKSEEYNTAISVSYEHVPSSFRQDNGDIFDEELSQIVDALDSIDDDKLYGSQARLVSWIKGNPGPYIYPDSTNSISAPDAPIKPLKYRTTNQDGIIYPAVEDLRVRYNLDESFETLGSEINRPELAEAKKLLLECYQYWISSIDNSKFNPTDDDLKTPKGDMSGFAKS